VAVYGLKAEAEWKRRRIFEFVVESLLFAFDYLEQEGFKPMDDGEGKFWVGDADGNDLGPNDADELGSVLKEIVELAPAAVRAMEMRGTPGDEGVFFGGVLMEAYARWTGDER